MQCAAVEAEGWGRSSKSSKKGKKKGCGEVCISGEPAGLGLLEEGLAGMLDWWVELERFEGAATGENRSDL